MSTWVFLRGLTREQRHWGAFPGVFRAHLPQARVITLDLPGNGTLHRMDSPTTVEAMAAHVRSELSRQGIEPPFFLLAMSLGAMVATSWAASHPGELKGCVLINTSMRPFSPFHERLRPRVYPPLLRLALMGGSANDWESVILGLTSHLVSARPPDRECTLKRWISYRADSPVTRANALRQLVAAASFRAPTTPPAVPLLLLASTHDGLVNPRCSRRLASAWRTEISEHSSASHDLPLDDPAWVAAQVKRWSDGLSSGEAPPG